MYDVATSVLAGKHEAQIVCEIRRRNGSGRKSRRSAEAVLPFVTGIAKTLIMWCQSPHCRMVALLCLLQFGPVLCNGHECGDNPMKQVLLVAKRTGRTLSHVLTLLKEIDNPAYDNLSRQFSTYATCVGLVDTGYFRKRGAALRPKPQNFRFRDKHSKDNIRLEELPKFKDNIVYKYKPLTVLGVRNKNLEDSAGHRHNEEIIPDEYSIELNAETPGEYRGDNTDNTVHFGDSNPDSSKGFGNNPDASAGNRDGGAEGSIVDKKSSRKYNVERLKKWLYGPYRKYMNSYYLRWNLLWPLVQKE